MALREIWPEVPWTICYIIRNTYKSVRRHVFIYCISKTKNEFGQNPEENIILTGSGQDTAIWTGSLTKTNRENINVKYNIIYCLMAGIDNKDVFK